MPLWIVATPIGTLGDLSPRAKHVLSTAAVIAAEDTRHTRKLQTALGLPSRELVALHVHNEAERAASLVDRALTEDVVLVSDAGTPGVSDPGGRLVEAALEAGVEIRSVPGPSALAAALAASGLPAAPSTFLGFPPRKGRAGWAAQMLQRTETLVFFEAPGRITGLVADLAAVDPTREAVLCREISKRFEEILRRPLVDLAADLAARDAVKGECVLVVAPGEVVADALQDDALRSDRIKDVAAALATRWGVPRRDVYQRLLDLERELKA